MILINKQKPSAQILENIRQVKSDIGFGVDKSKQVRTMRTAFNQLDKDAIRSQLLREQKGICAYCMRRIHNNEHTVIEHLKPIDGFSDEALSYDNMVACCDGGSNLAVKPHTLCCDASKGNTEITISPYNTEHMEKIRYDRKGRIYIYPEDRILSNDINRALKLNGEIDNDGTFINDTATRLVYGRRQAYRNYEVFIKGLTKKKKNIKNALLKKEHEILSAKEYPEYAGVWLYFIRKKLHST